MVQNKHENEFHYHCRLSFKRFSDLTVSNCDMGRALFNNCNFESIIFNSCKFVSADWQGSQFYNCKFINCDFEKCSIGSNWFKECSFENCALDGAIFSDNSFYITRLENSTTNAINISSNKFFICDFINTELRYDVKLNYFFKTNFLSMKLFGSVFYNIFDECSFSSVLVDSYILGFQYGLTADNLDSCKFDFFEDGKVYNLHEIDFKIKDKYLERNMLLNAHMISSLNYTILPGQFIFNYLKTIIDMLSIKTVIKIDEIKFIRMILDVYYPKQTIAPIYIIRILNEFICFQERNESIIQPNIESEIRFLLNNLFFIKTDYLNKMPKLISKFHSLKGKNCKLKVTYNIKPSVRLIDLFNQSNSTSFFPKVIEEKDGSFVEIIDLVVYHTFEYLEFAAAFFSVVGVGISIKKFFSKKKKGNDAKKEEASSSDVATNKDSGENNPQGISNITTIQYNTYNTNYCCANCSAIIHKIANNNNLNCDDYTQKNVICVEVIEENSECNT